MNNTDNSAQITPDTIVKRLRDQFQDLILAVNHYRGDREITINAQSIKDVALFLKNEEGLEFNYLMDLTVVDYLGKKDIRFEVVYHFFSLKNNERIRVVAPIDEKKADLPSLYHIWKAANWFEREAFDLYGVHFSGHPDLRRIMLYKEFKGHPLRKDYKMKHRQPLIPMSRDGVNEDGRERPMRPESAFEPDDISAKGNS
jgi:NADH-quinone oxidoreductase subunit C